MIINKDLNSCLGAFGLEVAEFHDVGHDETLFEVSVDSSSCLRSFGVLLNCPCLDFVLSGREVVHQLQCFVTLAHNLRQATTKQQ